LNVILGRQTNWLM